MSDTHETDTGEHGPPSRRWQPHPPGPNGAMGSMAGDETVASEAKLGQPKVADLWDRFSLGRLVVAHDGQIRDLDEPATNVLGHAREDLVGRDLAHFARGPNQAALDIFWGRIFGCRSPQTCELQLDDCNGSSRELLLQGRALHADDELVAAVSVCDLTHWRRAEPRRIYVEEQLRRSQKMEAFGRLTSGIAHDFNNLLTLITGYARVLLHEIDDDSPHHKHVEKIARASKQASDLIGRLLTFGREAPPKRERVHLNELIDDFQEMLRRIISDQIALETELQSDLSQVRADPSQLNQILLNLANNARDAMSDGGVLRFETENTRLGDQRMGQLERLEPGEYVKLTVRDTGDGMDAQTLERIFEPFFTTKELGAGTGLGLATTHGIMSECDGAILVDSTPGDGSTFELYFPAVG